MIANIGIFFSLSFDNDIYNIAFVIRAFQIKERFKKVNQFFQLSEKFPILYDISLIMLAVLIFAHVSGCGFYLIGRIELANGNNSWIEYFDETHIDWDKYVASM